MADRLCLVVSIDSGARGHGREQVVVGGTGNLMVDVRGGADGGVDPVHPGVGELNPVQAPPGSYIVQDADVVAHVPGVGLHNRATYLEDVVDDVDLVAPHEQEGEGIEGGAGLGQQFGTCSGVGGVRSEGGEDGLGVPGGLVQPGLPKQLLVVLQVLLGGSHVGAPSVVRSAKLEIIETNGASIVCLPLGP